MEKAELTSMHDFVLPEKLNSVYGLLTVLFLNHKSEKTHRNSDMADELLGNFLRDFVSCTVKYVQASIHELQTDPTVTLIIRRI